MTNLHPPLVAYAPASQPAPKHLEIQRSGGTVTLALPRFPIGIVFIMLGLQIAVGVAHLINMIPMIATYWNFCITAGIAPSWHPWVFQTIGPLLRICLYSLITLYIFAQHSRGRTSQRLILSTDTVSYEYPGLWNMRIRACPLSGIAVVEFRQLPKSFNRCFELLIRDTPGKKFFRRRFTGKSIPIAEEFATLLRAAIDSARATPPRLT